MTKAISKLGFFRDSRYGHAPSRKDIRPDDDEQKSSGPHPNFYENWGMARASGGLTLKMGPVNLPYGTKVKNRRKE